MGESQGSPPLLPVEFVLQPVPDLAQQGVIALQLLLPLLDPVELLPPRAPGVSAVTTLHGEGVLREDGRVGIHLLLLRDSPVQREVHISQLPFLSRPSLPSSFTFLSPFTFPFPFLPFPLLSTETANMNQNPEEREHEAEDDESLHGEESKDLDVRVYPEESVDQGEGDSQESEALIENDGEVGEAALVGSVDDDQY